MLVYLCPVIVNVKVVTIWVSHRLYIELDHLERLVHTCLGESKELFQRLISCVQVIVN